MCVWGADAAHTLGHFGNSGRLALGAISIAAIIAGAEGPKSIARWAKSKREWLQTWIDFPDGKTPSRDCIRTFLGKVDPVAFQACFFHWLDALVPDHEPPDGLRVVAVDGKTMRLLHMASAWGAERHISQGQVATIESFFDDHWDDGD